ncbi:DUF6385 domain-containing protein [Sporosalibacterium faouarense]|uniref:DUF6385 domain-containing protein n=1 Tax=Sporosalibacterium faouarense TaxID=516123 RepID=UPI00141C24E7|nr:DUF6385 domain-containing protein [Sporosalibacterium faouarense]MTI48994.1 hypothetical protein [Bacillota bacterium]
MPNNIVFNEVASQLKTQIYGNNGGTAVPLSVDGSGNLTFTATNLDIRSLSPTTDTVSVTATDFDIRSLSPTTDTVTVTATDFDIRGLSPTTDTVTVTATDFDIRGLSPTTDTVTVTATNLDIRDLSGVTDSVTKGGNFFAESNTTLTVSDTGVALTIDTSEQDIYTFYVANTGAAAVSVKLQIAPTNSSTYYVDDPSGEVSIGAGEKGVLVAQKFLKFTRLFFNPSDTTSIEAFYNAHV